MPGGPISACQLAAPTAPGTWDSRILRSGPGLDLGPQCGSRRAWGDILPSPVPGLSVISRVLVPPSVCVAGNFLLNEGNRASPDPHLQPQGCFLAAPGGLLLISHPRTSSPARRPGGGDQIARLAGRFTVLPEKACPGPLQSRMALEVGTNSAHYFLRASPINNSFG